MARSAGPIACVMGDTDLVRALVEAGIRCAAVAKPGAAVRFSRFVCSVVDAPADDGQDEDQVVDQLLAFATRQSERPVLLYETDAFMQFVSRHRTKLSEAFSVDIADPELIEDLLDKARFQQRAERLGLRVPASTILSPTGDEPPAAALELTYPVIMKPLTHYDGHWDVVEPLGKAVRADTPDRLRELWPLLVEYGHDVLTQQLIPGPETMIESYHVYVDGRGETAGAFTGKKIRTWPVEYGQSTALTITAEDDVAAEGRKVIAALGLRGTAKVDFKRAPDGTLWLLEVNPRPTLWHYVGALAGVNLAALMYADLTGRARPAVRPIRVGACWQHPWDVLAARESGVPLAAWLGWTMRCDAKSLLSWRDPAPLLGRSAWQLREKLRRRRGRDAAAQPRSSDEASLLPDR